MDGAILSFDNLPGPEDDFGSTLKVHLTRIDFKDCSSGKSLLLSENHSSKEIMMFRFPLEGNVSSRTSMKLDLEELRSDMEASSLMRLLFIFLYNHEKRPDASTLPSNSDRNHSNQTEAGSCLVSQHFLPISSIEILIFHVSSSISRLNPSMETSMTPSKFIWPISIFH